MTRLANAVPSLPLLTPARAGDLIAGFTRVRLAIVGDLMLDQFVIGHVDRISPEAPVPIVVFEREEFRAGGAANVAHNACALGARVEMVGVVGRDQAGERLVQSLVDLGAGVAGIVRDEGRRTTVKMRVVTDRHQQVARVDYETDADLGPQSEALVVPMVERAMADASVVIVSDYLKGCVTGSVMSAALTASRQKNLPVLVDPKIPHLDRYRGARLVTPNHHEAEIATHAQIRTDEEARAAARAFRDRAHCEAVLITRGEHGMWLLDGDVEGPLRAAAREVSDVTGAGDTVIATLALAVGAGASLAEAAALANQAAGVVVGRFGPATLTREELADLCSA